MLIFDVVHVACDVRVNSLQTWRCDDSKDEVQFLEEMKTKRRFPVVGYEHILKSVTDVKNGI